MEIRYQTYRAAASKLVFPVPGSSSVVGAACHVRAASKPEQSAPPLDQYPSDANSQSSGLHVMNRQPLEAPEQTALYHNTSNPTGSSAIDSQGRLSFSPIVASHPTPMPATFTPSSLENGAALFTSDQWDSSLSHYGDTAMDEFAAGWDPMTACFPFWLVPEGLGDVLDTPCDIRNHNQQCSVETLSHPPDYRMQSQEPSALPAECLNRPLPDHFSDPNLTYPTVNSSGLHGKPPCRRFPQMQDNHMQTAEAETFGNVQHVPPRAYEDLRNFYATQCQDSTSCFVPIHLVQAFVDLYFEYFDPQFPFLHVSRLESEELPWILLLATAAIGSYYSELDDIQEYTSILCDLLGRAVDNEIIVQIERPSKPLIQSTFLRQIHLSSCGLHKEMILFHHQRHMLISMCYNMVFRTDTERAGQESALTLSEEWAAWLASEEETRLIYCTHMLVCIYFLFTDISADFSLFDVSLKMPCSSNIWYSKDIEDWKLKRMHLEAVRSHLRASQEVPQPEADCDPFLSKMSLLALYIDEKNIKKQRLASRLAMNSFGSYLRAMSPRISKTPSRHPFIENEDAGFENVLLHESIDHVAFLTSEPGRCHGSLPHVLAILCSISLRTLFAGTGWRSDTAQMTGFKTKFREFLERNETRSRKCLWHAACIYKSVQTSRHLASYDVFSVGVAVCYILLYIELRKVESKPSQISADTNLGPSYTARRRIVRLDQLTSREDVENWAKTGGDTDIHLTNVGILHGPDSLVRLLRVTEKAMLRQVAWSAFFRAWARTMDQLVHGKNPTVHTEDYNEVEERRS
ncbi:hypothetical protein J3E73DRAFT_420055 [Bipolaris maydis]|nr:hypothetical protein J3E73DRAFT_420055 [Bipolaris maydis]